MRDKEVDQNIAEITEIATLDELGENVATGGIGVQEIMDGSPNLDQLATQARMINRLREGNDFYIKLPNKLQWLFHTCIDGRHARDHAIDSANSAGGVSAFILQCWRRDCRIRCVVFLEK